MPGPGEYLADKTEGITRVEDLPKPKVIIRSRNYQRCTCPCCGRRAHRLRRIERLLHDLGDLVSGRPHEIHLTYSQHHCAGCGHYFNADTSDLALPGSHDTHRVVAIAVRTGRGGWIAVPGRLVAPLARPPGLRPLRHHPELGGGEWEKKRQGG